MCEGEIKQSPDPKNSTALGTPALPGFKIPGSATAFLVLIRKDKKTICSHNIKGSPNGKRQCFTNYHLSHNLMSLSLKSRE